MNSKALSAEAEISKILDDSIIMIYPATQELSREHFMTNWPDDQPSNKDMGYAFVGRVTARSASASAPARAVSSVKKYRTSDQERKRVHLEAIKEAHAELDEMCEFDFETRSQYSKYHVEQVLHKFDKKLARELALRASDDIPDDISEMGESVDVSFGSFHGRE